MLLRNLVPTIIISAGICLRLIRIPDCMIKGFSVIGKWIMIIRPSEQLPASFRH